MSSLGEKLRQVRKERHLTQQMLAEGLVTPSMISQIESDHATPSIQLLEQLANKLNVDISYFADDLAQKSWQSDTYRTASQLMHSGQYDDAVPLLKQLICTPSLSLREEALFSDLADCYERLGKWREASEIREHSAETALAKSDIAAAVSAYYHLGHFHKKMNHTSLARMYWQRGAKVLQSHPNSTSPVAGKLLQELGDAYLRLGAADSAIATFSLGVDYSKRSNLFEGPMVLGLGKAYMVRGEFAEAAEKINAALALHHSVDHEDGMDECHWTLGIWHLRQKQYSRALEYLQTYTHSRTAMRARQKLAYAYYCQTQCYVGMEDWNAAQEQVKQVFAHVEPGSELEKRAAYLSALVYIRIQAPVKAFVAVESYTSSSLAASSWSKTRLYNLSELLSVQTQALLQMQQTASAVTLARSLAEILLTMEIFPEE
ncbi:helix-turn-helix domain-containing protein [Alicyclobacillus tolerans]|uniref:helix-turn-helix domain-containing protein n=1 Tax=Alicyclobacillus tolerans TaxID=90970 RepID=UPI001F3650C1|nr:helix-turn-helix transcriptional regulator [Alicyclobacillus tolerans]MCF8563674.1 helix-turn-helix domain-containing protein [Alicyclobacillus tolerans]